MRTEYDWFASQNRFHGILTAMRRETFTCEHNGGDAVPALKFTGCIEQEAIGVVNLTAPERFAGKCDTKWQWIELRPDFTQPGGPSSTIYDASTHYLDAGTPLIILAGKEYGSGSSRDWAAKGTALLGVRAVIAESYERIHRSNLIGMGVLPLQFRPGDSAAELGLSGEEVFAITGLSGTEVPAKTVRVRAAYPQGRIQEFDAIVRIDTPVEASYYRNGGILPYMLRQLLRG